MSKDLQGEGASAQTKEQDSMDLSPELLEKVAGGRPVKPIRPTADLERRPLEKKRVDHRQSTPKY